MNHQYQASVDPLDDVINYLAELIIKDPQPGHTDRNQSPIAEHPDHEPAPSA